MMKYQGLFLHLTLDTLVVKSSSLRILVRYFYFKFHSRGIVDIRVISSFNGVFVLLRYKNADSLYFVRPIENDRPVFVELKFGIFQSFKIAQFRFFEP